MVSILTQINLDSHFPHINNTKINNKFMTTIAIAPQVRVLTTYTTMARSEVVAVRQILQSISSQAGLQLLNVLVILKLYAGRQFRFIEHP